MKQFQPVNLEDRRNEHLETLFAYLRIPSVSTDPARADEVRRAAEFTAQQIQQVGLGVSIAETAGHPVVVGAPSEPDPNKPTILIYGHYDVQPEDPVDLWETPPFEPTVIDGEIRARGATDNKGQILAHIIAAQELVREYGELPVNLHFVVEGEEEIGSPNLPEFIEAYAKTISVDAVVISDGSMLGPDQPSLTYGLRGMCLLEMSVRSAGRDLHSGQYGGGAPNAIHGLATLIHSLHDEAGAVAVEGFYDDVLPLTDEERDRIAAAGFDDDAFLTEAGLTASPGEPGYSIAERTWARPTLDINGVTGGFQGEGSKTVIPAVASAKISSRLVPGQNPDVIKDHIVKHLEAHLPAGFALTVKYHGGNEAVLTPLDTWVSAAAERAIEKVFNKGPAFIRAGGSIPITTSFQQHFSENVVLLDFGLPDDRAHAPNEKFRIVDFNRAIDTSMQFLCELGLGSDA